MQNFNNETRSAISLLDLNIETVVLTEHRNILKLLKEFSEKPDKVWCNGLGKKYLYKILLIKLRAQDKYFTLHPNRAIASNDKWRDFCDDCLILYCLNIVLNNLDVKLVHPDQYKQMFKDYKYNGADGQLPDLITGIPTIQ